MHVPADCSLSAHAAVCRALESDGNPGMAVILHELRAHIRCLLGMFWGSDAAGVVRFGSCNKLRTIHVVAFLFTASAFLLYPSVYLISSRRWIFVLATELRLEW